MPTSTIANRYQLAQLLRRDDSGEVWAARDRRLKRDVAVKLAGAGAAGGPQRREEFEAEARSVARLTHPNIALVYDSGEHEGRPYLVMERLPERTLADEVAGGPLAPERARRVAADVLAALAAAHQAGLVHGALTSESVLVCPDGRAKVSGFGVAQAAGSSEAGLVEQDLVGVGVLLDEALSGERSLHGDGLQPPTPDARSLAERRPGLPAPLVEVVERAVGRAPGPRFRSAAEMAGALEGAAVPPGAPAEPTQPLDRPMGRPAQRSHLRRMPMPSAKTAVGAVAVAAVVALLATSGAGLRGLTSPEPSTVPPRALPVGGEEIPAGRYHTTALAPAVAFTLGEGWAAVEEEKSDVVALRRRQSPGEGVELSFLAPARVFPAERTYGASADYIAPAAAAPAPDDLVEWLQGHPRLRVAAPARGRLGGASATQVDVEVASGYASDACAQPCVLLFQLDADPGRYRVVKLEEGKRMRLHLTGGDGPRLVVAVVAPADGPPGSMAPAEDVVDSVSRRP